jgi:hypothetical protein
VFVVGEIVVISGQSIQLCSSFITQQDAKHMYENESSYCILKPNLTLLNHCLFQFISERTPVQNQIILLDLSCMH